MNLLSRIKAAASAFSGKPVFPGTSGWSLYAPATSIDYKSEIGNPMDSSIVAPYLSWIVNAWQEAEECVRRETKEGYENEFDHPLVQLLDNPNPFYSGRLFREGIVQDIKIDGTAFAQVIKVNGLPKELYWIPSESMIPRYSINGDTWIDYWECNAGGVRRRIENDELLVWREGIDRATGGRRGYSRFKAGIAEAYSDNEARNTVNAILKNRAQMGVMVTPEATYFNALISKGANPQEVAFSEEQQRAMESRLNSKFTRDGRGASYVPSIPMTVTEFGSVLDKLDSRILRSIPEERLGAIFGVHPASVHFGAGLITSSDKHNIQYADKMSWMGSILPLQTLFEEVVNSELLPFMDSKPETARFYFDNSKVQALQEDQNEKSKRITTEWEKGILTLGVVQQQLGYEVEEELKDSRYFDLVSPMNQAEVVKSMLGQFAEAARQRPVYLDE